MAVLTTKARNKLAATVFGLPDKRAYPMPDKSHAQNALARAAQQANAGNLSEEDEEQIEAKARRVLKR